jgi:hypothetical protein
MFGAAKVARNVGSAVSSVTFHGYGTKVSGNATGYTINYPSGTAVNDIAVLFEYASKSTMPDEYLNAGWTRVLQDTYSIPSYTGRLQVSFKVLTEFDDLTSVSGIVTGNNMILLVFRPDAVIAGVSAQGVSYELTTGNPSQKTIAMAGAEGPIIGFGWYASPFVIDPRTSSLTMTETPDNTNNWAFTKHIIYNKADTPQSGTIDMDDESTSPDHGNMLAAFYLKLI